MYTLNNLLKSEALLRMGEVQALEKIAMPLDFILLRAIRQQHRMYIRKRHYITL